jgi:hypothetical protein
MLGTLVALAALVLGQHSQPVGPAGYALVQLTPEAACAEAASLVAAGATPVALSLRVYRLPLATARRLAPGLRARAALQTMEADRPLVSVSVSETPVDPLEPQEWWRSVVGIDGLTPPGPGRPVTVVDSGLELTHPEFANRPDTVALNPQEPAPFGGEHGTSVSSLVAAPRNGVGIVGIYPQALLRSWDTALGEGTQIDTSEVVKGIVAAADDGPGVINLSLGSSEKDGLVEQAIDEAYAKGSLVVVAAGNDGDRGNPAEYPADYAHVLTVGATNRDNAVAGFSSLSPYVDLAAPGQDVIVATASDSSWQSESGTSFSTPIVSGAAAWIWTERPQLDNTQLFELLRRSATDIGPPGHDAGSGYGLLDVAAALAYPAPTRDPLEPNDNIDFVQPEGGSFTGLGPLTSRARSGATLTARLDRFEDPRDVYRVWLRAGRAARVTVNSKANVVLRVWGPGTLSVDQSETSNLLAKDGRARVGRKQVAVKAAKSGRWAYVEVTLGGRRGLAAGYSLSVTA